MTELKYKPLSVNEVWQGRRFKTPAYAKYETAILLMLPKISVPPAPYCIEFEFGMSKLSDIDNPVKPMMDILQKKYSINDRDVMEMRVKKILVKKGQEFIRFQINKAA